MPVLNLDHPEIAAAWWIGEPITCYGCDLTMKLRASDFVQESSGNSPSPWIQLTAKCPRCGCGMCRQYGGLSDRPLPTGGK